MKKFSKWNSQKIGNSQIQKMKFSKKFIYTCVHNVYTHLHIVYTHVLCYRLYCVHPKSTCFSSKPPIPHSVSFGDWVLTQAILEVKSLAWALVQYDWCPYVIGEIWTQWHTEGRQCEETWRESGHLLQRLHFGLPISRTARQYISVKLSGVWYSVYWQH